MCVCVRVCVCACVRVCVCVCVCVRACDKHGCVRPARGTRPRKFASKMGKLAKMRPNLAYRYGIRMPTSTAKISYKKVLNSHACRGCCVQELNLLKKRGWGHSKIATSQNKHSTGSVTAVTGSDPILKHLVDIAAPYRWQFGARVCYRYNDALMRPAILQF